MKGYWDNEEETRRCWKTAAETGDVACMDETVDNDFRTLWK